MMNARCRHIKDYSRNNIVCDVSLLYPIDRQNGIEYLCATATFEFVLLSDGDYSSASATIELSNQDGNTARVHLFVQ
jgi:hypothetical protein